MEREESGIPRVKYWMASLIEPDFQATDSPAKPRGEAGCGQLDSRGGKEDSHAGHNDTGVEVLDGLDGLHLPDQLLFVHAHTGTLHRTPPTSSPARLMPGGRQFLV